MPGCDPPAFLARLPPSNGIRAPVIHDDASEPRKMASPLMSSDWPRRPIGMPRSYVASSLGSAAMRCRSPSLRI